MKASTGELAKRAGVRTGVVAGAVLAAGAILATLVIAEGTASPTEPRGTPQEETIATVTSNGLRVKLVAERVASQSLTATVRISGFARSDGHWVRLGRPRRVGNQGAWFWEVVTRRFGVHQLGVRMPGGLLPLQVRVRLLRSASLGASEPFFFTVEDGRLTPIYV